jgi:hypothetical protein
VPLADLGQNLRVAKPPEPPSIAVLAALATNLDDLRTRVGAAAEGLSASGDDFTAGELFEVERSLHTAARRLNKMVSTRR